MTRAIEGDTSVARVASTRTRGQRAASGDDSVRRVGRVGVLLYLLPREQAHDPAKVIDLLQVQDAIQDLVDGCG